MSSSFSRRSLLRAMPVLAVSGLAACTTTSVRDRTVPRQISVPLRDLTVPVHLRAGRAISSQPRLVVVMHGTERNPVNYLNGWNRLIKGRDVVLLAPEFTDRDFPGAAEYNLGGMRTDDGDRAVSDRAFAVIDSALDLVRDRLSITTPTAGMFGHSAGAQFVHRYLTFTADSPIDRAVAANAGWYTMPDRTVDYPYGLGDAPQPRAPIANLLGADLTVMLGDQDTDDENLRQDAGATDQGKTRLARGKAYFKSGSAAADQRGVAFGWQLTEVPGVGHDHAEMSQAAADVLLSD